jgi:hypothetical protein
VKRIVHTSDLHVGFGNLGERFRMHIQRLKVEKGDDPGNYVILISGDLVDNANDESRYEEVKSGLDDLRSAGFEHILVVPGSHDYGTGSLGDKRFVAAFQKCFYGHNHIGRAHNGGWGVVPRCYDAGTATLKPVSGPADWLWDSQDATRVVNLDQDPLNDYLWPLF